MHLPQSDIDKLSDHQYFAKVHMLIDFRRKENGN